MVVELCTSDGDHVIVKASTGPSLDHHLDRELRAHRLRGAELGEGFPVLLAADDDARLLATRHLPGRIAEGSEWEWHPGVHRAAGALLGRVHRAARSTADPRHDEQLRQRCRVLHAAARPIIEPTRWAEVAARLDEPDATSGPGSDPAVLVPTHGDFQPRNWLVDPERLDADGAPAVSLIDFGRFDLRPWYSDLVRLHHQVTPIRPDLRDALVEGMGRGPGDPIEPSDRPGWHLENLVQALGTVVWATDMGLDDFASHGRIMVDRTLAEWSR